MTDLQNDRAPTAPQAGAESSSGPSTTETVKHEAAGAASTVAEQGRETASTAVEAGSQLAGSAADGARQVASDAAQQAGQVTRQATDQARRLAGEAQASLREQAGAQTQRAATGLRDLGREMQGMAGGGAQGGLATDAVRQLGDTVTELAGRIEERGFDGTVEDLRRFAARRPGLFLAGAAAAGFLTVRLSRGLQTADEQERPSPARGAGNGFAGATVGAASSTGYVGP